MIFSQSPWISSLWSSFLEAIAFLSSLEKFECVKVTQSCPTLYDPTDHTVHGILQARILEWVAIPFSRKIFPTQGSNPGLPHRRWILYQLSHQGNPKLFKITVKYSVSTYLFYMG